MTTPMDAAPPRHVAGRREWYGLVVLALPALLASLELTVTHLALPTIGRDLSADSTELLWIVDVYAFLLAGSLITMGVWGDRIGRRRMLLLGAAGYGVASVAAAYAPTVELLIVARAVMGVAGSTLMPAILSLVTVMFVDARQRAVAIGVVIASVSGGTAVGPLVGGWLLERYWWGSVFLLGVPVMLVLLVVGPALLPERRAATGRLDLVSALLSLGAVLPVVYGLKRIAADGVHATSLLAVVAGLAAAVLFVRRQRGRTDPFLDLGLFADRRLTVAAATLALGIFVLWGSNLAIAQYLQLVQGLSPLAAGMWTAPSAVGVIVGSTLAPRIARRVDPATVTATGLALAAVGYGLLTQVEVGGLAILVTGAVVVSAGLGPMMALATDMVVGAAPPQRAGAAAAISATAPQLGGAFGIALLGSLITAVYRHDTATTVPVEAGAEATAAARDNLTAALVAADRLPVEVGERLLAAAREAFVHGFRLAAVVSAVLMAGTALLVAVTLRRRTERRRQAFVPAE
ncbi:MFS transporter [Micromonospora sp. NPDC003241]